MSNRFTSFRLYDMHKLIPVFKFTSQFSLIRAPSSRKPIVVPGACSRKLISVLRLFALRAAWEELIKFVNRGITVLYFHDTTAPLLLGVSLCLLICLYHTEHGFMLSCLLALCLNGSRPRRTNSNNVTPSLAYFFIVVLV
jgi:hypothetical protein